MLYIVNKVRQNRILPSVTYKMRCAHFPAGRKGVKFCGKRKSKLFYYSPQNEGKTAVEHAGFSP